MGVTIPRMVLGVEVAQTGKKRGGGEEEEEEIISFPSSSSSPSLLVHARF
jgi:hypothetical protein